MIAPDQSPATIETSRHVAPPLDYAEQVLGELLRGLPREAHVSPDRVEDARAMLRRDLGAWRRARRMLLCPALGVRDAAVWQRPCRLRACRACADRHSELLRDRMVARASGYASPVAVMVTCPSGGLTDLPEALRGFRAGLRVLRRRRWFGRVCVAGVLAIECPLTGDRHRWHVHGHGVIDVRGMTPEWWVRAEQEWRQQVGAGGEFGVEPLRALRDLAGYAVKLGRGQSWSPDPGELPSWVRAHLDRAIRGRQLVVEWPRRRSR